MKNRAEINYLTILGLSLTVVIAVCKDDARFKNTRLRILNSNYSHTFQNTTDVLAETFLSFTDSRNKCFLFDNYFLSNSITTLYHVFVDIKNYFPESPEVAQKGFLIHTPVAGFNLFESHDIGKVCVYNMSDVFSPLFLSETLFLNRSSSISSSFYFSFPVRAGPEIV